MTAITRRGALLGLGAAAVVAGVPSIAATKGDDANVLAMAQQWHQAYGKFKEACLFEEANPDAHDEYYARGYGEDNGAWWGVHEELSAAQPKTITGAVAMLGCVQSVAADRGYRRAGGGEPSIVFFVHTDRLQKNAYVALERLARKARS